MKLLPLLALLMLPVDGAIEDRVHELEINHVYCNGQHSFTQIIGWEFDEYELRMQVVFWRMQKENMNPGNREFVWHDGEILRRLRYDVLSERWLNYDVELAERSYLPQSKRRGLTTPRTASPSGASEGDLTP